MIRKALIKDIPRLYEIMRDFAERGLMLPRSLSELYDVIRDFHVWVPDESPDKVEGFCAVHVCWQDLGEIRSLSVAPECQGRDIGRKLVQACMEDARALGVHRLFVLTYIPKYFEKFGFDYTDKNQLPHKIWADCLKCIKFPECGEVAMERSL